MRPLGRREPVLVAVEEGEYRSALREGSSPSGSPASTAGFPRSAER